MPRPHASLGRIPSQEAPLSSRAAGFTLVEVLLALVLLGVGALALLGGQAHAVRLTAHARIETRASAAAAARIAVLSARGSAAGCAGLGPGSATHPLGLEESWAVGSGSRTLRLTEVLTYRHLSGRRADTVATVLPCP